MIKRIIKKLFRREKNSRSLQFFIGNLLVFGIKRHPENEEIVVFGKRVLSRPLPKRYLLKNFINISMMKTNRSEISKINDNTQHRILYILDTLEKIGGVETRLASQLDYLSKHGITPMILTEYNRFAPTFRYVNFHLDYSAPNSEQMLIQLIQETKAVAIEFQLKPSAFFESIDKCRITSYTRLGVCIHSKIRMSPRKLDGVDYCFLSSIYLKEKFSQAKCLPNWVNCCGDPVPLPAGSSDNKRSVSLFISRISSEKFPTLCNFVKLCRHYHLNFKIAGSIDKSDRKLNKRLAGLHISDDQFIGPIKTIDYLKKHAYEILLVAGVGQVPLEAAALGLPALVTPHIDRFDLSTVLTEDSFKFLRPWNMTIKQYHDAECLGNIDDFLKDFNIGKLEKYNIQHCISKYCNIENSMKYYQKIAVPLKN